MEKIPFNLEKYNTGEYDVVTRDGRSAKIICTDMMDTYPVVGLVETDYKDWGRVEIIYLYSVKGKFAYSTVDELADLFLIPKEKQEPKKEEPKKEEEKPTDDEKFRQIKVILRNSLLVISEKKVKELEKQLLSWLK